MTTLTVPEARTRLRHWLLKALAGQDVGVVIDGRVVALRPTKVHSEDWAEVEYEVTAQELDHLVAHVHKEKDKADKTGELVTLVVAQTSGLPISASSGGENKPPSEPPTHRGHPISEPEAPLPADRRSAFA